VRRQVIFVSSLAVISLTACTGLTQLQDTVAKFDQGAHTASTAEIGLFKQVQVDDCLGQFYRVAFAFATASKDQHGNYQKIAFDVDPACTSQELTVKEIATRQALLDTITLYADSIQTSANGNDDKSLSSNSEGLVNNIRGLAQQECLVAATSSKANERIQ
jgi:hypothetical protein